MWLWCASSCPSSGSFESCCPQLYREAGHPGMQVPDVSHRKNRYSAQLRWLSQTERDSAALGLRRRQRFSAPHEPSGRLAVPTELPMQRIRILNCTCRIAGRKNQVPSKSSLANDPAGVQGTGRVCVLTGCSGIRGSRRTRDDDEIAERTTGGAGSVRSQARA
jgi:hypothetical protein